MIGSIVRRLSIAVVALFLTAGVVPHGRPEDVGLSSDRLRRIDQVIQHSIDANEISGAVTMVSRRGRVAHFEAHGLMDIEGQRPMRKDAIFRIASMTKPVTGVAILMLMEEGRLRLTDPVSRFIPEFKHMKVAMAKPQTGVRVPVRDPEIYTVAANREITIRDLLTHTSGLQSGGWGTAEAERMAPRRTHETLAQYVPRLGSAPLDFQPGTQWRYSALAGVDVLGRIVEIASGITFDRFLATRIFEPLGMVDTAFRPSGDRSRVVTLYRSGPKGLERVQSSEALDNTALFSGGAGLWSTAQDYMQFAQMLVNGGVLDGTRLLSPRTVDLMASNHVRDLYPGALQHGEGVGFGLTVEVVLDSVASGRRVSNGTFGWAGAYGTDFWVDRREQLVGLLMVQQRMPTLILDLENAVMQAIVD